MLSSITNVSSTLENTFTLSEQNSPKEMFKNVSKKLGEDGTTIAKNQITSNLTEENSTSPFFDESESDFLNSLLEKWNKFSDSGQISIKDFENKLLNSRSEEKNEIHMLFEEENAEDEFGYGYGDSTSSITQSFDALIAAVGGDSKGITKMDLINYLAKIKTSSSDLISIRDEVSFLKNLIAQFDIISDGSKYIKSFSALSEPQDPETITVEQVTSPVDLRV